MMKKTLSITLMSAVVSAGDFSALVTSMRSRAVYVNLHSTAFATGELRGQAVDADDAP